jgi:hypothetical protein
MPAAFVDTDTRASIGSQNLFADALLSPYARDILLLRCHL